METSAGIAPRNHATSIQNHWWWRPGWRPGRRFYACHITLQDQPQLQRLILQYQNAINQFPNLDMIPTQWLHLTMQGIGFTDEISSQDIRMAASALRNQLHTFTPPLARFAQPIIVTEAIYIPAEPACTLRNLREITYKTIKSTLAPTQFHEPEQAVQTYKPHVSIAYVNASAPVRPIIAALEQVNASPVTTQIKTASILTFHRDNRMYEWTSAVPVPIGPR
jgi:2'-5' RNA ligase